MRQVRLRQLSKAVMPLVTTLTLFLPVGATRSPSTKMDPITAAIQPFVDSHSLAGAVMLVANKSKVLSLTAVGFADVPTQKPMATNALFWIASESKPITATAFMMLVDEGKVSLDDAVAKYLPEFGNLWVKTEESGDHMLLKRPNHPITIREILSHTSGLHPISAMEHPTFDLLPLKTSVASYAITPLDFQPGTQYEYSNAGINTVGRIIEVVSGMPYEKFLQERLFKPLGMVDTTFHPNRKQIARLASSYQPNASKTDLQPIPITQVKYPLDDPSRYAFPAGGLFSTAQDLCHFAQMILNGGKYHGMRFVSENAIHEMTRKQTADSIQTQYGLGWSSGETFGHGGAYATNLEIDSRHGLILIWMVQHHGYPNNGDQSFSEFAKAGIKCYGK